MKKHLVIALAALFAGSMAASAQMQVLKDAERAQKSGKAPSEVVNIITPAFSDPETATLAQTYYIPGKAMFGEFDQLFGYKQFNKLPENGDKKMADDLLEGYVYYMKALPLDTVTDAKGKVKTKYSKDIVNTITGHAADYNTAALTYWELKEFANAYRAWDIFLGMYETEPFAKQLEKSAPADTVIGEVYYNQALAAWQADSLANALGSFTKAKAKGYNKKQLYDYAIAVASNLGDQNAVYDWATAGQALYGKEEPSYLGYIINTYLQNKDFDKAFSIVDEAIANDPSNPQYYFVKGVLYDNQDKKAEAKAMFKKSIDLNPEFVQGLTQYGAALCQEAYKLSDEAPTTAAESQAYFDSKIKPLFQEAAQILEKAWNIDNNNTEALRYLDNIYYNLKDEKMQEDVKARQLQ